METMNVNFYYQDGCLVVETQNLTVKYHNYPESSKDAYNDEFLKRLAEQQEQFWYLGAASI